MTLAIPGTIIQSRTRVSDSGYPYTIDKRCGITSFSINYRKVDVIHPWRTIDMNRMLSD